VNLLQAEPQRQEYREKEQEAISFLCNSNRRRYMSDKEWMAVWLSPCQFGAYITCGYVVLLLIALISRALFPCKLT
jgi:hypothetical protein